MAVENARYFQDIKGVEDYPQAPGTLAYLQSLVKSLPLFQHIQKNFASDDLLKVLTPFVNHFQRFEKIIVLGTGGSSLGGQTLLALQPSQGAKPSFHFIDNIDPDTFQGLFSGIDREKTGVIAISKSGNTAETIVQILTCLDYWGQSIEKKFLKNHFLVISEASENGIRHIASAFDLPCLNHPPDIGGRFAAFTVVGILPALIAGINVHELYKGAAQVLDSLSLPEIGWPLQGALVQHSLSATGITQTVLMPYADRLKPFSFWFRQLWAESLGKQGKGMTPVNALGTVDQHSQLQLYLDGPRDKFFTLVTLGHDRNSLKLSQAFESQIGEHAAIRAFRGKSMGDLMHAEQQAVLETLLRHKRPVRVIHVPVLNESAMGALLMHYMLETLAMAHLMEINPFDQPAVEEIKILAQQRLSG